MGDLKNYIESGIIEMYVLGLASAEEMLEVENMAVRYEEVRVAIDNFSENIEKNARDNAIEPDATIKAFVMATINYTQRLEGGEAPASPPILTENSSIADYSEWLEREDLKLPSNADEIHARIIGYTPQALTAIVWLKDYAPTEVHHNEYERFLVVEGSCRISVEDDVHELNPGKYLQIPLHKNHKVTITSSIRCKVILQRVAA